MIELYTDGSAIGNPGPGGYAAILRYQKHEKVLSGAFQCTTNNRMELLAVIVALEVLKKKGQRIVVYSDSRYVVDAVMKGWLHKWLKKGFKKQKNSDLWRRFWQIYQQHEVTLHWVEGHAGHPMNERCDRLAVEAAKKGPWAVDNGYRVA